MTDPVTEDLDVLVIGAEQLSVTMNMTDRPNWFIFGDGAGAVVVGPTEQQQLGPVIWGSDGSQFNAIRQDFDWVTFLDSDRTQRPYLRMEGTAVFRWAAFEMGKVAHRALEAAKLGSEDLDVFVPHQANMRIIDEFAKRVRAVRIIENAPSALGGIGDIYNAFMPSLTLGCGSYGRNSGSNNVSAVNLVNVKRVGRRNNNLQWFKVPAKTYFEPNAIRYLIDMKNVERVTIVTDPTMTNLGFVDKVIDVLNRRRNRVHLQIIDRVQPEPKLSSVVAGAAEMREFNPDTIIALGGGSPMDAAKVMWLLYESPDVQFSDMREKFFDVRKRAFKFPDLGKKAQLVCVPTTSGTGSEMTPFAVITDDETGMKYPLADYALTPSVAIIDPVLTSALPAKVVADAGFDALTHATEAYVSVYANDYTDGLALHAIKLIFENIERSAKARPGSTDPADIQAREKMHNAASIAGMAFGNAFLGIVHAMAHVTGSKFHLIHGRTNAIYLPHVIRYNGRIPTKLTSWPKYERYIAPERFQQIAQHLGLKAATPEEGVESYARAVEKLRDLVGIERSFQAQGVAEEAFIGRLDDMNIDGMEVIEEIRIIYDNYGFETEILAASIRHPVHVLECARIGADVGTMPPKVIKALFNHVLTDKGIEGFLKDWAGTGQSIL